MGDLPFCQVEHLGFCLVILLALSMCYASHVTVLIEGFIECASCIPVGVTSSKASSGTGLLMNIDCKLGAGSLRRLGTGEVDDTGNFKIKFLQDNDLEDQAERGSCFLKLDGASAAPCPGQEIQNVLVMISKSIDSVKRTPAVIRKLKFSSITCTSAILLWPSDKKNKQLIDIPTSPGKSSEYPHPLTLKDFLVPKSSLMETFPNSDSSNLKPLYSLMSRKLLGFPHHIFKKPIFPNFPIIQYPSPEPAPSTLISPISKPFPPPTPNFTMPLPSVPPPVTRYNPIPPKAPPLPNQTYRAPPQSQRLVPSATPPPMIKTPDFPPLAPTYKNLIPVPAPAQHLKKPLPPVAPAPTYKKPTTPPPAHSPRPIIQEPSPPPVPTFKKSAPPFHSPVPVKQPSVPFYPPISPKPTISPSMHSPRPILQKPNPSPVPAFKKSAPPPQSPAPIKRPIAPMHPPISPRPTTPPSVHSPRPIVQKPNPPPVPAFNKSTPPHHSPVPVKQPNAPLHPPISPKPTTPAPSHSARTPPIPKSHKSVPPHVPIPKAPGDDPHISPSPMSHPSPKWAHNSAPSPLPIINPTPPTKQPATPLRKSSSPIPKAPLIPQLPPTPTVPRRYFNSPKYGSHPPSPPS